MEHAIFVADLAGLDRVSADYQRVYFGHETCERLLPDVADLARAVERARERGLSFTLVTPFLTDRGLERARELADALADLRPGSELVVNDWGLLRVMRGRVRAGELRAAMGRLLAKQARDPRLGELVQSLPGAAGEHFRQANLDAAVATEFLVSMGVERIELDHPPHGLHRPHDALPASLVHPYVLVTTTRLCPVHFREPGDVPSRVVLECRRSCGNVALRLRNPRMPRDLLYRSNAIVYRGDALPDDLEQHRIDRLVFKDELAGLTPG